jgi:hypothetical protein
MEPYRPLHRHRKQLTGIPYGIDTKREDTVDREHRRHESKAKCHGRDDGEGGERCTTERADRVEDVAYQIIDDTDAPSVAALIGGKRHLAEARQRPLRGHRRGSAPRRCAYASRARCETPAPRRAHVRRGAEQPGRDPEDEVAKDHGVD